MFLYYLTDLWERGIVLDLLTFTTNVSVSSLGKLWLQKLELSELSQWVSVSTLELVAFIEFSSWATLFSVFSVSFRGNLNCYTRLEVILLTIKKTDSQLIYNWYLPLETIYYLVDSALLNILCKPENILIFIVCQRSILSYFN